MAIDVALLTVLPPPRDGEPGRLATLVQRYTEPSSGNALPGRFLRKRQTIEQATRDVLRLKVGLDDVRATPKLIRVFDDPDRDERGWTLSLAHALVLPYERVQGARGDFIGITCDGRLTPRRRLLFDHEKIIREAAAEMRERYELRPDPDGLIGDEFTLGQLRALHEAVLGESLLKDTFNRRMRNYLAETGELRTSVGRPAQVYRRAEARDPSTSDTRRLRLPRRAPTPGQTSTVV